MAIGQRRFKGIGALLQNKNKNKKKKRRRGKKRTPPPRRRARPKAANPVPQLANSQLQLPRVDALYAELSLETRGRGRFATASETDLYNAAGAIVRDRLGSLETIRQTDRDARRVCL